MNKFRFLIANGVLTCVALLPAASLAEEDLDVTMDVIDDLASVEGVILETRGPDGDDAGQEYEYDDEERDDDPGHDGEDERDLGDRSREDGEDDFEDGDRDEFDDDSDFDEEDGGDEGDEVDLDEPDEAGIDDGFNG